jgi:taurine dioxygenase
MSEYRHIEVKPLSGAIGADVHGVDISKPLGDDVIAEIRKAYLEHLVIGIRDQTLEPATQLAFAKRFGEPMIYPFVKGLEEFPEVTPVIKKEDDEINFGGLWHSDTTYEQIPPMGTMLYAREIPPVGGDTEFASMYRAYETLSDGMRRMLDSLIAVNISGKGRVQNTRAAMRQTAATDKTEDSYISEHPAIRTHPETGRKALYVNGAHTTNFKGMTIEESTPILDYLYRHQTKPEFTCRFKWEVGSLAFWDNRCAQHNPLNDYHGYRREMHRVTLRGDKPV